MATELWYPLTPKTWGTPFYDHLFSAGGGADKESRTKPGGGRSGPATHDDATTYIYYNVYQTGGYQMLQVDWPSPIGAASEVKLANRTMHTGGGNSAFGHQIHSSEGSGTNVGSQTFDEGWTTRGPTVSTRPGGGSWTAGDFVGDYTWTRVNVYNDQSGSAQRRFTSVWGEITFSPPGGGGLLFMLGLAGLAPLVGTIVDFAQFLAFLSWRRDFHPRRTVLEPVEVRRAWAELKAYRAPSFMEVS